jgi:hypothetical protein
LAFSAIAAMSAFAALNIRNPHFPFFFPSMNGL